jgi:hypothetical protein
LDATPASDFARIIALARAHLELVQVVEEDCSPERAILRLTARYGRYRVFITEIISRTSRHYRYYVLDGDIVVVGFDNAADARALRLKYGRQRRKHIGELIPHLHLKDKTQLELTEEMTCTAFLAWLQANVQVER